MLTGQVDVKLANSHRNYIKRKTHYETFTIITGWLYTR